MCRIDFFYFSSDFFKNSDLVQNEFGSVRFKKTRFSLDTRLFATHVIANITVTVDDMTLTSLTTMTTSNESTCIQKSIC